MSHSLAQLEEIFHQPFFDLLQKARAVHAKEWQENEVQLCTLLSIKTGGCSEDCAYCAQSSRYQTDVSAQRLLKTEDVMPIAQQAKESGSTRFCMGAAWKGVRDGDRKFEDVLGTIREVSKLGMEVCVTLGNLTPVEAAKLKEAGVTAYNHNIDTSPEYYSKIVSTHTFEDRLNTISAVQGSGMSLCCGGILGMGETVVDRLQMLQVLASFNPQPESVPINCLVPIPGTPMENAPAVDIFDLVRQIATTRLVLPRSKIRLSAGRKLLSREAQALCFFAGANSIFYGDKLLTTANPEGNDDLSLLETLDLKPQRPFSDQPAPTQTIPAL
ncbi:MAG: biotin synthase BioB [Chthoniobacterales bacterium]